MEQVGVEGGGWGAGGGAGDEYNIHSNLILHLAISKRI